MTEFIVQAPRELRLAINRSGDSIGIVAVDYNIVYVPPSTSTQADTADLVFTGSVRLQGGESTRDFSVTIPDTSFLEVGGNFMATLANATLVGGGNRYSSATIWLVFEFFYNS